MEAAEYHIKIFWAYRITNNKIFMTIYPDGDVLGHFVVYGFYN